MVDKESKRFISPAVMKIIDESLRYEIVSAKEAGTLGYMAQTLVQATIPHRDPGTPYFERQNGSLTLTMSAPSHIGLPYGTKPRLLLLWLTTEVARLKNMPDLSPLQKRTLVLGNSLSEFMSKLELTPTGGRWGSIHSLREQTKRLFSCSITIVEKEDNELEVKTLQIASSSKHWWQPHDPDHVGQWGSTIVLNEDFYTSLLLSAVPIDMRDVKLLRRSPMALDVYIWLVYRLSYLNRQTVIPWELLQRQFGADIGSLHNFQRKFKCALHKACAVYHDARLDITGSGLKLKPSPLHLAR